MPLHTRGPSREENRRLFEMQSRSLAETSGAARAGPEQQNQRAHSEPEGTQSDPVYVHIDRTRVCLRLPMFGRNACATSARISLTRPPPPPHADQRSSRSDRDHHQLIDVVAKEDDATSIAVFAEHILLCLQIPVRETLTPLRRRWDVSRVRERLRTSPGRGSTNLFINRSIGSIGTVEIIRYVDSSESCFSTRYAATRIQYSISTFKRASDACRAFSSIPRSKCARRRPWFSAGVWSLLLPDTIPHLPLRKIVCVPRPK